MKAVAALLREKYEEQDRGKEPMSLKFRTPWPLAEKAKSETVSEAAGESPRAEARAFAKWTVDISELSAERGSFGSLLVAMRAKLSQGGSKLTLAPGSSSADSDAPSVQHYSLRVEWQGDSCELTFAPTRPRNGTATYWERKTPPVRDALVSG